MKLLPVTPDILNHVINLKPAQSQMSFVAPNVCSLAEAWVYSQDGADILTYGIQEEEIIIGFVMIVYNYQDNPEQPEIYLHSYNICRFMIDEKYQGRGYGHQAMEEVIHLIQSQPCGPSQWISLSYEPENTAAARLYHAFGFIETGDMDGDEILAIRPLEGELYGNQ